MGLEWSCTAVALAIAVAMRPWRALPTGPPWVWLAWWATLPLLWATDRYADAALAPPMSGASLGLLMAGWPLAVLGQALAALVLVGLGTFSAAEALQRMMWLGLVPASLALLLGAAVRRWLPNHLFVYIFLRGFFGTLVATAAAAWLAAWRHGSPPGLNAEDLLLARWLAAWGEAIITGMLVAIFVAYRPAWLATYSDRLYLPRR